MRIENNTSNNHTTTVTIGSKLWPFSLAGILLLWLGFKISYSTFEHCWALLRSVGLCFSHHVNYLIKNFSRDSDPDLRFDPIAPKMLPFNEIEKLRILDAMLWTAFELLTVSKYFFSWKINRTDSSFGPINMSKNFWLIQQLWNFWGEKKRKKGERKRFEETFILSEGSFSTFSVSKGFQRARPLVCRISVNKNVHPDIRALIRKQFKCRNDEHKCPSEGNRTEGKMGKKQL